MIKVAIIINELLVGGAQRIVVDLANHFDTDKFEINLILLKSKKAFAQDRKWLDHEIVNPKIKIITISDQARFSFKDLKKLWSVLKSIKPDVVHTFLPYAGIIGRPIAWLAGIKNIVSTQCNVPVAYSFVTRLFDRLTLIFAKLWIAPTDGIEYEYAKSIEIYNTVAYQAGRRHFTINFATNVDKIKEVLSNVNIATKRKELGIPQEAQVVTMTGRLHAWKGQEDLVEALAKLPENVHLVLIGDGVMRDSLEQQAESLGIKDRIHFLGTRDDVFEILAVSNIYVQAHRKEKGQIWIGKNSTQVEAAVVGLPSISTNVPLIDRFIEDGITGKIVEANNPDMMTEAISWILKNPEKAQNMAKKLQTIAADGHSMSTAATLHQQLYIDLIS